MDVKLPGLEGEERSKDDPPGSIVSRWRVWKGLLPDIEISTESKIQMLLDTVLLGQGWTFAPEVWKWKGKEGDGKGRPFEEEEPPHGLVWGALSKVVLEQV